jgi:hypothetical protein
LNIIDALHSRDVFAPLFRDPATWRSGEVYLRGLFGLGLEAAADRRLFRETTGLERVPAKAARESFVICGRRSGKSFMSALIAAFLAGFVDGIRNCFSAAPAE